jgi:hypothetical protein
LIEIGSISIFCLFRQQKGLLKLIATHKHLRNIDCLTTHTACLVCFSSSVNGRSKRKGKKKEKEKEKKPINY